MNASYLLEGLALGLASGVTPGPMFALVLAAALRGGFRSGAFVALAPLVTDLPIIVLCVTVLVQLPAQGAAALSIAGGGVLAWFAYEAAREARTVSLAALRADAVHARHARWLRRGIAANVLNPAPWLFWMSVGGPLLRSAWREGAPVAVSFVLAFYALLIGTKLALAYAAGAGRVRLHDRAYRMLLAGAAVLLLIVSASLLHAGVTAFLRPPSNEGSAALAPAARPNAVRAVASAADAVRSDASSAG